MICRESGFNFGESFFDEISARDFLQGFDRYADKHFMRNIFYFVMQKDARLLPELITGWKL